MAGLILGSLVDRVQDVIGLAAVAAIGALLLPTALDERSRNVFWVLAITAIAAVAVLALVIRLTPVRRLPLRPSAQRILTNSSPAVHRQSRLPGVSRSRL